MPVTLTDIMQSVIDDTPIPDGHGILHHGEGVDLLPANITLSGMEIRLINAMNRERALRTYLGEVKPHYDYILIDCMPSLGIMPLNSLAAADSVIIPSQPSFLSAKGLDLLMHSISQVKRQINPKLKIDGILFTMVDSRTNEAKEIIASLRAHYGEKIRVFGAEIPFSVRAAETSGRGKSIYAHDKNGKVAAAYSELLNSLDSGATTKITINNRRLNKANFEQSILMPMRGDSRDVYRREYNQMLLDKVTGANSIMQEKYITISVAKKDIEEARTYFSRVGADLISHFAALGSKCSELDAGEKLRVLHDFYRQGEEAAFHFDPQDMMKKGHDFKDYICPDSIEKNSDYLKLGEKYCRVLFLKDYASYIKDSMVTELTDFNRNMMLSIDVVPVPTDEAVREVENRLLGVDTNITNWQRRQNANNNFSAVVPYDMELQRKETKEFLDDLTTRDQRMMFAVITMVITADDKKQLDSDTETVLSVARKHMCQLAVLKFQQFDGLNTVLPIGTRKINAFRTLTTESLAVFMPFKVQEVQDKGGIYFGENAISHNLIMCNKANLLNQSAFLLGVPGSGKSFSAKELIAFLILNTEDDVLICDPENEFGALAAALGEETATVIHMAAGGKDRLNAMYMVDGYGENNPIVEKSQFIMSLVEQIDKTGVGPQQKSIIDRCTALVYQEAEANGTTATLCNLRNKLLEQPEEKAKEIALSLELFTTGSLDIFGHESTVDLDNRIVVFDIHSLGAQLKPTGLLVITDTILNRVTLNWKKGKRTHIFIDEFHVVFENEQSGIFFNSAWRQFRKRNGYPTAITQNVEYLLDSVQASTMLSNSEFVVMLNQAYSDRAKLSKLLNISDEQMSYVTNADAGCGLIKYGSALVPFINRFPKDTELYRLMTTRPGEGVFGSGNAS